MSRDVRDMVGVSRKLVAYNLAYLTLSWGAAIAAITLFWLEPAWYTFALAFLVVSSRQQALLNCEHEAVHRKFLRGRQVNDFVGKYLCAAPVGSPYRAAQARHLAHHRLLSTPGDPDHDLHSGEPPKNTPLGLVKYFASGLLGGYAVMVLLGDRDAKVKSNPAADRADLLSIVIVQGILAAVLTIAFSWWVYPLLWLGPLATVTALCHLIRSFVEHAISTQEMPTHSNRLITIRSSLLERGLVSPYFMNYHAEHHLVPSVPAPRLRELQRRLAERSDLPPMLERRSYGGALRRYVQALRG